MVYTGPNLLSQGIWQVNDHCATRHPLERLSNGRHDCLAARSIRFCYAYRYLWISSNVAIAHSVAYTVVANPNPVATPLNYRAASNSSASTLSFSVPSTNEDSKTVIWAWR